MIGNTLREEIEKFHERMSRENPLFVNARNGRLTPREVSVYLANILYLIQHTPVHLKLALQKATERESKPLVSFFKTKLKEEEGHDAWAENDLSSLVGAYDVAHPAELSPTMLSLVQYITDTINTDPTLYLAYIVLAEYFTVLIAPGWLSDLSTRCNIPSDMLSVVKNHAELDKDHVIDDLKIIDSLADTTYATVLRSVLQISMRHFEAFAAEIGTVDEK